jgi:CubicO group peptidase (beta-lactamase class C family)
MSATVPIASGGLERLHAALAAHVGDDRMPGLVTLVGRGEQVHVETLARLANGARDSIFRISSMSKPITAAATLAVAADG